MAPAVARTSSGGSSPKSMQASHAMLHASADLEVEGADGDASKSDASQMGMTASGAVECARNSDLVVGVLASPSQRSTAARQAIRDTWAKLPTPGRRVTLRFLLALNASGNIPQHLVNEGAEKDDLLFLHTLDKYENLSRKVELFFKWVIDACVGAVHIFKTDDDSFVRLDELAKELSLLPRERMLYVGPTRLVCALYVRVHACVRNYVRRGAFASKA